MLKVKIWTKEIDKDKSVKRYALVYDLEYRLIFLNFNLSDIAEILGVSVKELREYPNGDYNV